MCYAATFEFIERSRCLKDIDRVLHATIYMYNLAYKPNGMSRTAFCMKDELWERDSLHNTNLEKHRILEIYLE